jgi:hypothetical protein
MVRRSGRQPELEPKIARLVSRLSHDLLLSLFAMMRLVDSLVSSHLLFLCQHLHALLLVLLCAINWFSTEMFRNRPSRLIPCPRGAIDSDVRLYSGVAFLRRQVRLHRRIHLLRRVLVRQISSRLIEG